MASTRAELDAASPFGDAVRRIDGDRLLVNMAKLRRVYELTAPDAKKRSDRGTCGRLHSEFIADQSEYEDDRYE